MLLTRAPALGTAGNNKACDDSGRQRETRNTKIGKRAPQKQRTCEDCEVNLATQFCSDCQPPLVLCDECAVVLHRGVTRRNHQLKGEFSRTIIAIPISNSNHLLSPPTSCAHSLFLPYAMSQQRATFNIHSSLTFLTYTSRPSSSSFKQSYYTLINAL